MAYTQSQKPAKYLHNPSGIISNWLFAAENTSRLFNLPMPEGIPSKSNLLSLTYSRHNVVILHKDAGNDVSLFRQRLRVFRCCHSSVNKRNGDSLKTSSVKDGMHHLTLQLSYDTVFHTKTLLVPYAVTSSILIQTLTICNLIFNVATLLCNKLGSMFEFGITGLLTGSQRGSMWSQGYIPCWCVCVCVCAIKT